MRPRPSPRPPGRSPSGAGLPRGERRDSERWPPPPGARGPRPPTHSGGWGRRAGVRAGALCCAVLRDWTIEVTGIKAYEADNGRTKSAPHAKRLGVRLVLDTNTVVSGLFWAGAPGQLQDAARDGKAELSERVPHVHELVSEAPLDQTRRDLLPVGEHPDGFAISSSKTVHVPAERLFDAVADGTASETPLINPRLSMLPPNCSSTWRVSGSTSAQLTGRSGRNRARRSALIRAAAAW